jgi:periplasmic copper chaperone A
MQKKIAVAAAAGALALPAAAAQAHVTIQPNTAPAGNFVEENVRVPNEQDKANTTKVAVKFPDGFASVAYQPKPGWTVTVKKTKLAKPIQTDDGPVTEQVSEITWTGDGKQGKIAPGEFMDFPLSVQVPGKAGDALTFKAIQTYDNGQVVRWIGPPTAAEPAPQVQVTAAEADGHGAAASGGTQTPVKAATAAAPAAKAGDSASKALGIAALVVGGLGLLAGLAALVAARRRPARA